MKQKKQFIEAKTLKGFQTALSLGKVSENQIGFIEKENLIWTRGQYYGNNIELNEEDINKNLEGKIQFADRPYDEANFSGKGYKILRKNIQNGKNILTQEMINKPNTVYEIRYDFDLNGTTITIPAGCTLKFDGGSFNNGTIITNNTTKLINYNGNAILNGNHINSGLFSNKPINTIIGKTYFCTDKKSPESTQPGLMIYHKGNNVWIDSMNRIVDDNYPKQTKIFVSKEEVSNAINNDLFRSSHNIVTSLSNVLTDKFLVIAEIQTAINQSFSLSGNTLEAGKEIHVIIHNNSGSKITVTIPDNLPYINCNGESILSILENSYAEINIISIGDKLYVRTI